MSLLRGIDSLNFIPYRKLLALRTAGSFSEDRPLGWDPVAEGNRAGDGMARFVSEEKAPGRPTHSLLS